MNIKLILRGSKTSPKKRKKEEKIIFDEGFTLSETLILFNSQFGQVHKTTSSFFSDRKLLKLSEDQSISSPLGSYNLQYIHDQKPQ